MQIGEIANDFFRIALGASSPAFLARALAEQLFFRDDRNMRLLGSSNPVEIGATVIASSIVPSRKAGPGLDELRGDLPASQ